MSSTLAHVGTPNMGAGRCTTSLYQIQTTMTRVPLPDYHHYITTTTTTTLRSFVQDYPGEMVPLETFNHSHLSCSSANLYQLPPSTTIHSILPAEFTCLTVFSHNLSPLHQKRPTLRLHYQLYRKGLH